MISLLTISVIVSFNFALSNAQTAVNEQQLKAIEEYIDPTVNPCRDVYSYACGNWRNYHKTASYSEITSFLDYKVNLFLIDLLQIYDYGENSVLDKVWSYYKSCRRESKRHIVNYLEIVKPTNDIDWPLLEQLQSFTTHWPQEKFNWLLTLANLQRYGLKNVLIESLVLQNSSNAAEYVIDLDKPNLAEWSSKRNLATVAVFLMEVGLSTTKALKAAGELLAFENEIENVLAITEADYRMLKLTIKQIKQIIPELPFQEYFSLRLGFKIAEDFTFQINNLPYFLRLAELLKNADPELICNYLMFHFLYFLSRDGSSSANKLDCINDVRSKMDLALNYIYMERLFENRTDIYSEDVREILKAITAEFHKKISEHRVGFTYEERVYLSKKLDAMQLNIGNLPQNASLEFIAAYYEDINLDRRNYCKNHLQLLHLRSTKELKLLVAGNPTAAEYFFIADRETARSSTPFYLVHQNLIVLPYGFLKPPIYHHNMHNVLKYSLLGAIIAHEVAHGMDRTGIRYDYEGTLDPIGIDIIRNDKFSDFFDCIQSAETTNLNEYFADLIGLRLAYDAYFNGNKINDNLVQFANAANVNSTRKLFFLNYAQFYCGTLSAKFADHDTDDARLKASLSNFEAFAETYQCDLGDSMNPVQKCRLW